MPKILCALLSLFLVINTHAQSVVNTTTIRTESSLALNLILVIGGSSIRAKSDVELVRIEYTTTGTDGEPDVASGLILIPTLEESLPLHVHFHGTTTREKVPSTLDGGYELGLSYASQGHLVIMPDFLGMGESRGFHPYVHRETQASAALDMLLATQEYLTTRDDVQVSDQLIVAGYSQGGHAAMSFQGLIETEYTNEYDIVASTPMSGPYDLSGAFKDFIFGENEYFFPGYILYQIIGYKEVDPSLYNELSDILKPDYVAAAEQFAATGRNLSNTHDILIDKLIQNEGKSIPVRMFKDEYAMDFLTNEDHVLNMALRENDTYNFVAKAPTRIIYCKADDQVPYQNSIIADSILNANGSDNVSSIDISTNADHGGCIFPAVEESLRFINLYLTSTPVTDIALEESVIKVYPNPTSHFLTISQNKSELVIEAVDIYNISGQMIRSWKASNSKSHSYNIDELETGTYVVHVITDQGSVWKKIIKQ